MSDFPPSNNLLAINPATSTSTSSKNKKQGNNDSTTPSEVSSPALTDGDDPTPINDIYALLTTAVISSNDAQAAVLDASATSSTPVIESSTGATNDNTTTTDHLIKDASETASALPATPIAETATSGTTDLSSSSTNIITEIPATSGTTDLSSSNTTTITEIPADVSVGIGAATTTTGTGTGSSGIAPLPEPLPLSESVQYCIKTVVASGSIDIIDIVEKVRKNAATGDYNAKADLSTSSSDAEPRYSETKTTPPTIFKDSKKIAAGIGAALKVGKPSSSSGNTIKLSDNVQHCIRSAVNAPTVDVYGYLGSTSNVNNPEPSVGGPAQPNMPSFTEAASVAPPKKGKPSENRKSNLATLKKNCIIS